jgi:tripartite-type tricarboxylate transporter receptor subunit TctC
MNVGGALARRIGALLVASLALALPSAARAEYPDKPIRLIVPQAAGSATDTVARILAAELSPQLGGQSVIVEDRPGGALTIGIDIVAKSAPDGYTIGVGPIGALAITRHMVAKLPYNIEKDLQPIALIARGHLMLAVSPKSGFKSVKELVAYAKANPGKLTNASSSNGSPGHVGGELFKFMTGTQIQHVPYRGGAAAINDLIAGRVDLMFESLNSISPHVKSGSVLGLAVTGDHRSVAFPDVPTVAEAGVPGYSAPTWSGVIGPAGLPRPVLDKLNAAINRAIRSPAFIARFVAIGDELAGGTPEDFAATIAKDSAKWKDVVERAGVKLD